MTEHFRTSELGNLQFLPGVFFFYDLSPIKVGVAAYINPLYKYNINIYSLVSAYLISVLFRFLKSFSGDLMYGYFHFGLIPYLKIAGYFHGRAYFIFTLPHKCVRYCRRYMHYLTHILTYILSGNMLPILNCFHFYSTVLLSFGSTKLICNPVSKLKICIHYCELNSYCYMFEIIVGIPLSFLAIV